MYTLTNTPKAKSNSSKSDFPFFIFNLACLASALVFDSSGLLIIYCNSIRHKNT